MLLCLRGRVKSNRGSAAVHLNVYDLSSINGYAHWLGLGVYHSGVQVHDVEYAFGAHQFPTTGIFEGEPKACDGFQFRKSILIGWTDMSPGEVRGVMEELGEKYRGDAYSLLTKNCNHFCNDACIKLAAHPIPNWVNRLARIGSLCHCIVPANLCSTKVGHYKTDDKVREVEKKHSSNSSSVTSSSSPPPEATIGSQGRSPLPTTSLPLGTNN